MAQEHHHVQHHQGSGNLRMAFFLNLVFAIIELLGGLITNSVAILSDAVHDLGDSITLGISWYLQKKSRQPGNSTYTYGYQRFSLLGALVNALVLMIGSLFVIAEAIERLRSPEQADAGGMVLLALLGIVFNGLALLRLRKGSSLNERVVSLHFIEDVLGWVAVLIGAVVMMFWDVPVLDPLLSLAIAAYILFNVYRNLLPVLRVILQGVPSHSQQEKIRELIVSHPEVKSIHDFRLWSLDGEECVLSFHLVLKDEMNLKQAEFLKESIKVELRALKVAHATIEIEYKPEHAG